jgi:hypothetical protein
MAGMPGRWKFAEDGSFVERECLLFEAGDYPDRGVTITIDDLRDIAGNSAEVPVKVEHLAQSPFDGALGTVSRLRVAGSQLFGILRQPIEAWRFIRRAGARSLSIALDLAAKRVAEVSFVCSPRVATAQVFGSQSGAQPPGRALFVSSALFTSSGDETEEADMVSVRQFADGLMQYVRGVLGGESPDSEMFSRDLTGERAQIAADRESLAKERAEHEIESLKRKGLIRATNDVESMAGSLLRFGVTNVVQFGSEQVALDRLFVRFLEANGPVVPLGELAATSHDFGGASDRLISMARDTSKRESIPYLAAFSRVSAANPDLARAARDESING